jgi:hypothetical protein
VRSHTNTPSSPRVCWLVTRVARDAFLKREQTAPMYLTPERSENSKEFVCNQLSLSAP